MSAPQSKKLFTAWCYIYSVNAFALLLQALGNALHSLTMTYPCESRSLATDFSKPPEEHLYIRVRSKSRPCLLMLVSWWQSSCLYPIVVLNKATCPLTQQSWICRVDPSIRAHLDPPMIDKVCSGQFKSVLNTEAGLHLVGGGGWQRGAFAPPCLNLAPPWNLQTLHEVWEQD